MSPVSKDIECAAFEAHMAAATELEPQAGRQADAREVAKALAHAFGEALGICAAMGATPDELRELNELSGQAYLGMLSKAVTADCAGAA